MTQVFDSIWAYNHSTKQWTYDNKLYVKGNALYWMHTNKYARPLDKYDLKAIKKYTNLIYSNSEESK